ncbi:MAG: WD40-repeat-containing domain protein [Piptocephalis tieghemiana]|nr:MAG: WD40-repeat-containing domain protein [Piptocephalis tieghemiana]
MQMTSDEVNCLIYHYLHESGFQHTSFSLQSECDMAGSPFHDTKVKPGALVEFLQKGLLYHHMQLHLNEEGVEIPCANPVSLIGQHECVRPSGPFHSILDQHPIPDTRTNGSQDPTAPSGMKQSPGASQTPSTGAGNKGEEEEGKDGGSKIQSDQDTPMEDSTPLNDPTLNKPLYISPNPEDARVLGPKEVSLLKGHVGEVFIGQWNPKDPRVFASGGADGHLRIWTLPSGQGSRKQEATSLILACKPPEDQGEVQATFVDWHPNGNFLAVGTSVGEVQVWTLKGERKFSAWEHEGALIVGRWSARGTRLLTGGADGQVILWSRVDQGGTAGRVDRRISYHKEPVMDVTWRSDEKFIASSSQDLSVCIWKVDGPVDDSNKPWKIYKGDPEGKEVGHTGEPNCVSWDPLGKYLASCGDDCTVRIWDLEQDTPVHVLQTSGNVYSIRWRPETAPASDIKSLLLSLSLDQKVRLWDVSSGLCVREFDTGCDQPYALGISPDGRWISTGGRRLSLVVWRAEERGD